MTSRSGGRSAAGRSGGRTRPRCRSGGASSSLQVADGAAAAGGASLAAGLAAGAGELEPAGRAGADPHAVQQVQGGGWWNGWGGRGPQSGRVGSVLHQGLHGLWCARPGRVTTAPASLLAGAQKGGSSLNSPLL